MSDLYQDGEGEKNWGEAVSEVRVTFLMERYHQSGNDVILGLMTDVVMGYDNVYSIVSLGKNINKKKNIKASYQKLVKRKRKGKKKSKKSCGMGISKGTKKKKTSKKRKSVKSKKSSKKKGKK